MRTIRLRRMLLNTLAFSSALPIIQAGFLISDRNEFSEPLNALFCVGTAILGAVFCEDFKPTSQPITHEVLNQT